MGGGRGQGVGLRGFVWEGVYEQRRMRAVAHQESMHQLVVECQHGFLQLQNDKVPLNKTTSAVIQP